MHTELPRCFLNTYACEDQLPVGLDGSGAGRRLHAEPAGADLGLDRNYTLLLKQPAAQQLAFRDEATPGDPWRVNWTRSARGNLASASGWSSDTVLRFAPLDIPDGGTYKVCFCDSDLTGGVCESATDFKVELGSVYASGVSCLLGVPRMRTASCIEQYYGGLRCTTD
jgi:hypothetical protein